MAGLLTATNASAALDIPHQRIILRGLDKVTARISRLELDVGERVQFGDLAITAQICFETPPTEPPESAAFLEIEETEGPHRGERPFVGWMYASDPGYSALEHPVYDVWVIDCQEPVEATDPSSTGSPEATEFR